MVGSRGGYFFYLLSHFFNAVPIAIRNHVLITVNIPEDQEINNCSCHVMYTPLD